ncbi:MAG: nicotinate phosphoribosyltransferase, partial [Candidatus Omnitrophica bacterium]|nr:nicotinate phosphoribosyltransferase [Candidatus Omnitrophota bacterium]
LKEFKFKGEIWGVEEPEIIYPLESILTVTGNLIEAQIIESLLLNKLNLALTLATKSARIVLSAKGRGIYDFSLRRTQGIEASLACAKYSYIAGAKGTSNLLAGYLYNIPVVGTMAHSFVMSFEREIESFLAFAKQFPTKSILLIDTYNTEQGIEKAIRIAKTLQKEGFTLLGVRLDSGDLAKDSNYVRAVLDRNGLIDTLILVSGNLDEYKINKLVEEKKPIDMFGVGTHMGCSSDQPFTDVIYKLVEIKEKNKQFIPTMKLSEGKITLPGRKQIFRIFNRDGLMEKDYIGLREEKLEGKKLLKMLMKNGHPLYRRKTIEEKRKLLLEKMKKLPEKFKNIDIKENYPVHLSKKLISLTEEIKHNIIKRSEKRILFFDIDTQFDFISSQGALYVKNSEEIVDNIKNLCSFAKKNNIKVISSQDTHSKDDPEFKDFPKHCVKGTKGYKKLPFTLLSSYKTIHNKPYPQEEIKKIISKYQQIIIEKNVLNVFSNPNTEKILKAIYPDEIYVFGVATEYCVKEAIEGLLKNNFSIFIIEDAVKEISFKEKEKLFPVWKKKGIRFERTKSVLENKNILLY